MPHPTDLESRGGADRDEPGERAREAIEVGLHQGALLMLEELDVTLPDEITGRPSSLRDAVPSSRTRRPRSTASKPDRTGA